MNTLLFFLLHFLSAEHTRTHTFFLYNLLALVQRYPWIRLSLSLDETAKKVPGKNRSTQGANKSTHPLTHPPFISINNASSVNAKKAHQSKTKS